MVVFTWCLIQAISIKTQWIELNKILLFVFARLYFSVYLVVEQMRRKQERDWFPQESKPLYSLRNLRHGQWECWESGRGVLGITSQGLQAACLLPGSVVADPVGLESLLEAFHLRGLGVLETRPFSQSYAWWVWGGWKHNACVTHSDFNMLISHLSPDWDADSSSDPLLTK